jgi:hypothetical protein
MEYHIPGVEQINAMSFFGKMLEMIATLKKPSVFFQEESSYGKI